MKLAWITDTHFAAGDASGAEKIADAVRAVAPDALLVTGDISDSKTFSRWLLWLSDAAPGKEIYFVLGNHDFYDSWVETCRYAAGELSIRKPHVRYLTSLAEPLTLAPRVALVGHDGWADGRLGIYDPSVTKDARRINSFGQKSARERHELVGRLGAEAAEALGKKLAALPGDCRRVIIATHVPPFPGSFPIHDDWLPHMACDAMGEMLLRAAETAPERVFEVYCGHTHRQDSYSPRPNLTVHVGAAALRSENPVALIDV